MEQQPPFLELYSVHLASGHTMAITKISQLQPPHVSKDGRRGFASLKVPPRSSIKKQAYIIPPAAEELADDVDVQHFHSA